MVSLFEVGRGGYLALGCYCKNVLTERYLSGVDVYSYQITTLFQEDLWKKLSSLITSLSLSWSWV